MDTTNLGKASLYDRLTSEQLDRIGWDSVGKVRRKVALDVARAAPAAPAPSLVFDTKQRKFQIDPYPVFAQFRLDEPVHRAPPPFDGWFVFRYDDVVRVCDEGENFSAAEVDSEGPRGLFQLDEPPHDQVRSLVEAAWLGAATNVDQLIKDSIEATLAALAERTGFDLVDDFARPVPRNVYFDILGGKGISSSERGDLDKLARTVMKHHDHTLDETRKKPGAQAGKELGARLHGLLGTARLDPSFEGSFLARLAPAVADGQLNPVTAVKTLVSLTVAGYMSVEFLLASGVRRLLLGEAHWWQKIEADRTESLLPAALEEMRRFEHALAVVDRFAKQEVTLGKVVIPKGARVFGVLASANRDERVFGGDADEFKPGRKMPKAHLGLGHGIHECMGRALERLITKPAISALMAAMPSLRLQSDEQPLWFENFYFRSFDNLKVTTK